MEATNNKSKKRMIQVKLGNQEAKSLMPSEAAEYLQSVASMGARDLRVQFGNLMHENDKNPLPKKQPGLPCTEKEMKALMSMFVEIMGLQMNTERLNETKPPSTNLFHFPTDVPPPPGGWPDDLTWPNTDTLPPLSDTVDEDSSLEGLPALEEIPEEEKLATSSGYLTALEEEQVTGTQGIAPFEWDTLERVAVEEALEHEERTRKNFRRGKKEKITAIPNEAAKKVEELNQAALQKAEQLFLARKKAIMSWRNAVTVTFHQVCQNSSTSVSLLQEILEHSPLLQECEKANPLEPHLEEFLPLLVRHRHKGQAARLCLARFVLRLRPLLLLTPIQTIGRSVLHIASWWGESELVDHICQVYKAMNVSLEKREKKNSERAVGNNLWPLDMKSTMGLDGSCHESGWSPVHYAAISGNLIVLEVLLRSGCKVDTKTNSSHTWSRTTGNGVSPHELVQCALSKANGVETLGTAWLEISKEHKNTQKRYTALLNKVSSRLEDVARGKLEMPTLANVQREVEAIERQCEKEERPTKKDDVSTNNSSNNDTRSSRSSIVGLKMEEASEPGVASGKRARKKKNKPQVDPKSSDDNKPSAVRSTTSSVRHPEDPVMTALLGMGFQREKVLAAICACGGHDRATVDNAVAWIFGQQDSGDNAAPVVRHESETQSNNEDAWNSKQPKKKEPKQMESLRANEKPAVQKDEQRGRNSERANRQGVPSRVPESNALKSTNTEFPVGPENPADSRKPVPSLNKVREEQIPGVHGASNGAFNESSTVASSIEHRTIEIFNDDATVSTLGSIATRSTIVPHTNAPPGFHVPPTMLEEPLSSSWNHNMFATNYGSNPGPPPAISGSMVMQNLGLHKSPVASNPPPIHRNQNLLDPHHQPFVGHGLHHDTGSGGSNAMLGGMHEHISHFSAGQPARYLSHHQSFQDPSPYHHYDTGLSVPYPFLGSSNLRNDNNGSGSSVFPSSNAPDPLIGLRDLVAPEPTEFPIPLGLGLEPLDHEHEGTSLWGNEALALSVDNSLGVCLFGLSNEEKMRPPHWSGDGLGGSIW